MPNTWILVHLFFFIHLVMSRINESNLFKTNNVIKILMPRVRPTQDDHYLCTSLNIESYGTQYIRGFHPNSNADTVHHMILYTCDSLEEDLDFMDPGKTWWDCGGHAGGCNRMKVIYAWAKNAASVVLPTDVAFRIGEKFSIRNLLLEIHYAHALPEGSEDRSGFTLDVSSKEPKYLAGMLILLRSTLEMPPHKDKIHGDINCPLRSSSPIHPFAYRTHTHKLGVVVSGYKIDENGTFTEIGKGNPQWPQAFYKVQKNLTIHPNEYMAARCTYSMTNVDTAVHTGSTAKDEMCNFYIMFYTNSRHPRDHFLVCADETYLEITNHLPTDSDVPLPQNISLDKQANKDVTEIQSSKYADFRQLYFILPVLVILLLVAATRWIFLGFRPMSNGFKILKMEDNNIGSDSDE